MFKRKVFYMGGFDPRGVRFYHGLYREAAGRWSALTGKPLAVSPRRNPVPHRSDWTVVNEADGAETSYAFLRWEDLVQRGWIRNPLRLAAAAARTYLGHLRHMDRALVAKLPRGPLITTFYPPVLALLLPVLFGLIPCLLALIWLPWWAALLIGLAVGAVAAAPLLKRMHVPWLLQFFIYNARRAGGEDDPALAERLDAFAAEIARELDGDWDEVLLVTHSNGSILAVPLMLRLLRARGGAMPADFALVTLGQCIPLILARRDALRFRGQMRELAEGWFRWFDIGSPPDGAAFHAVDPMRLAGAEPQPELTQLSPRFHLFYDPATYHKGYANKYEIHFDYLRVGDRVSPLDYPAITASARPIEESVAEFRAIP